MQCTRRGFVSSGIAAGVAASSAYALSNFAGEIRANAIESTTTAPRKARILFNENPLGPSPIALAAIESNATMLGRYPLSEGPRLEMKLRKLHGLSYREATSELSLGPKPKLEGDSDLLIGIGSSEILKAVAWAYGSQAGNIVEAYPSYSAVGDAAIEIPGSKIERKIIPLDSENRFDTAAMIKAIDLNTKVVVICNPNNPTGTTIPLSQIVSVADATPKDAVLLVDEAYIEFLPHADKVSAIELAKTRKNVIVARTFSKVYGLAGLRIGYGLGSTQIIEKLRPFMLGQLSLSMAGVLAAEASLDDRQHMAKTLSLHQKTLELWTRCFKSAGWKMTPSEACFCWVDVGRDATPLVSFLAERGVLISGGRRWKLPNYVRISMGTEEENERLIEGVNAFSKA